LYVLKLVDKRSSSKLERTIKYTGIYNSKFWLDHHGKWLKKIRLLSLYRYVSKLRSINSDKKRTLFAIFAKIYCF
uniref:hypothetical protein n=1 Tax=Ligilactobacillus acidipiscis TaxID=89059 RepID=UPI001F3226D9